VINTTTLFIIGLFLLVASAVIVGELFTHFGQAALVGQLLVGVILGPSLLGGPLGLTNATVTSQFSGLLTLATFFILLMAGLSVSPKQLRATGLTSLLMGVAMFFVPFLTGAAVVRLLFPSTPPLTDLFLALTVSITALPVLGIMLREFDVLATRFGATLLNASVVNELSAVTVFAILLRIQAGGGSPISAVGVSIGTVLLFLGTVLGVYLLLQYLASRPAWKNWVRSFRATWNSREAGFALLIVAGLGAALYSQYLGLTFVIGAFYAGMLITPEVTGAKAHKSMSLIFEAVTWGFFIPLFFALVGFNTNFSTLGGGTVLAAFIALAIFAIVIKFVVGSGVALSLKWSPDEAFSTGFLVTSRGTVELAMAVILLNAGVFTPELFTIAAGVGLITTFVSPIGARPFITRMKSAYHRSHRAPDTPGPPEWVGTVYLPPVPAVPGASGGSDRPRLPGESP
jgi:Kef-type K+ transport system membrane component KefB